VQWKKGDSSERIVGIKLKGINYVSNPRTRPKSVSVYLKPREGKKDYYYRGEEKRFSSRKAIKDSLRTNFKHLRKYTGPKGLGGRSKRIRGRRVESYGWRFRVHDGQKI